MVVCDQGEHAHRVRRCIAKTHENVGCNRDLVAVKRLNDAIQVDAT
jgi:hypothetical protein